MSKANYEEILEQIETKVSNLIKQNTISVTTNSEGCVKLSSDRNIKILNAWIADKSVNGLVIPYWYEGNASNSGWYIRVSNYKLEPVTRTTAPISYLYIET